MVREAPAPPPLAKKGLSRSPRPKEPVLDVTNIQGNILAGFKKDYQTFLFLRITNASAARTWLRQLLPYIATTWEVLEFNRLFKEIRRRREEDSRTLQATWVNVALSFNGLRAIEKAAKDLAKDAGRFRAFKSKKRGVFSVNLFKDEAFREGLTSRRAKDKLNDPSSGEGEPSNWKFGGPGKKADIVVIVASDDRDDLNHEVARIKRTIRRPASGLTSIYTQEGATLPGRLRGHEHFGYLDGVSQPGIRGLVPADPDGVLTRRQNPNNKDQGKPGQDLVWPGEFVFGYPGQMTKPGRDSLGKGKDAAGPVWARDGSYFVVRRLRQNVPLFHKFLEDTAKQIGSTADRLGAKLVGRWTSGAPVMRAPLADNTTLASEDCANNHFEYQKKSDPINPPAAAQARQTESHRCTDNVHPQSPGDKTGDICPFAAHIRKTYPRDDTGTLMKQMGKTTTQTHRLLRRGIPYGTPFFEDRQRDERDRGLVFAAYQTSIINQFEFVQSAWANNPDFKDKAAGGKLVSGFDLIIGQAGGDRKRSCPVRLNGKTHLVTADKDFVIPTGGGYFFAPSIDALCLLTGSDPEPGREAEKKSLGNPSQRSAQ